MINHHDDDEEENLPFDFPAVGNDVEEKRTAKCGICAEWKQLFDFFDRKSCTHLFCNACVSRYVAAKVERRAIPIGCPQPGCKEGSLELEMCRPILSREVADRWNIAIFDALLLKSMKEGGTAPLTIVHGTMDFPRMRRKFWWLRSRNNVLSLLMLSLIFLLLLVVVLMV